MRNLCLLSSLLFAGFTAAAGAQTLTLVSWGGSYGRSVERAWVEPFIEETGIEVRVEDYNGGLAQIRAQVETGNVFWDVVDTTTPDSVRACDEGLLELVPLEDLPAAPDGTPANEDLFPNSRSECASAGIVSATIVAYNDELFPGEKPAALEDYFDLEKFPGRRGMRRVPVVNLEFALIADGVPLDEVYATLDTEAGIARAFAKLDTIKDQIVFWEAGAQPPQMLADQEVVMTTAYNGRIFNAQVLEDQPFTIIWNGHVQETGGMGIVLGTPRLELAKRFIEFLSRPENLAQISRYISYSPARYSANALVSTHLDTGIEMAPHMPASERNTRRALNSDWLWWADNRDEMNERFSVWLSR
ncbi:MAG: ABC transporter substrate-binding protein [Gammaproteobacteria bacterium]|nr:ABC transporter substrate-binding protein [Gammaproteobacteria bacterium]MYH85794.1 ABC transporter substrate-binding protein [Gammaproteobacteria bacterium]MYK05306.1 ABC transporter substrate-binding protein [Gammaproteobacteria bacterium]